MPVSQRHREEHVPIEQMINSLAEDRPTKGSVLPIVLMLVPLLLLGLILLALMSK